MRSISVVINARLKSSRVPNKLIRSFSNTCLINIALEKLNKMFFFENRYLGVADSKLKDMAKNYSNINILDRKVESVKPGVNLPKVSFAHYLEIKSDYIFIFNPCQPFLTLSTIKKAYDYFQETNFSSYTSVTETRDWIFDETGNCITNSDKNNYSTNSGRVFHKASHSFHIVQKEFFRKNGYHWTFKKDDPHLIKVPISETLDVDTEFDFELMSKYYSYKKSKNL